MFSHFVLFSLKGKVQEPLSARFWVGAVILEGRSFAAKNILNLKILWLYLFYLIENNCESKQGKVGKLLVSARCG